MTVFNLRLVSTTPGARNRMQRQPTRLTYNALMTETNAPSPPAISEQETLENLVARMARAEEAALAQFYDATAACTYALARRIVRDMQSAEEVVSDVYLQAWQQAGRYDVARGRVLAWLLTICRSRALDRLRRRDAAEVHPDPHSLRPDLYRDDVEPVDVLLAFERDSRARTALAVLDAKEQRLIALAFFDGMSHQEIATYTGMPLGSVKTVLRRALQIMRGQLCLVTSAEEV
jgi:RNA polymerase sigma factor (sigma-70 family)